MLPPEVDEGAARIELYAAWAIDAGAMVAQGQVALFGSCVENTVQRAEAQQQLAEWRTIAQQTRTALETQHKAATDRTAAAQAVLVADREHQIEALRADVADAQRSLQDARAELASHDAVTEDRLREQKRQLMAQAALIRSDLARVAADKEKMRFEREAAATVAAAAQASSGDTRNRAATAVDRAHATARAVILEAEARGRVALSAVAEECNAGLMEAMAASAALVARSTAAQQTAAEALGASLLQLLGELGEAALAAPTDGSVEPARTQALIDAERRATHARRAALATHTGLLGRPLVGRLAESFEAHRANVTGALLAANADNAGLRQATRRLRDECAHQTKSMADLEETYSRRCAHFAERCRALDGLVEKLSGRVADDAVLRARHRAAGSIVETLAAEHDAETTDLRRRLAEAEGRGSGGSADAGALGRAQAAEHKYAAEAVECARLRGRLSALEAALSASEADAAASISRASALRGELSAAQRELEHSRATAEDDKRQAVEHAAHAEAHAEELAAKVAHLQGEADRKDEGTRAIAATVEELRAKVSASELAARRRESHRRSVVLRERERRRDHAAARERRAAKAEARAREREETVAMAEDAPGSDTDSDGSCATDAADEVIAALEERIAEGVKERQQLRRELDEALAEVGAAEERRHRVLSRHLDMLAVADAAPRRAVALQGQEHELNLREKQLAEREGEVEVRAITLKKREGAVAGKLAALRYGPGAKAGGAAMTTPPDAERTPDRLQDRSLTSAGSSPSDQSVNHLAAVHTSVQGILGVATSAPTRLAPISHRAAAVPPAPSTEHPQRMPVSYHARRS